MSIDLRDEYASSVKFFHWLIALLVILMLIVGFSFDLVPSSQKALVYMLHKSTGITILFLMVIRFVLVQMTGRPPLPFTVHKWEIILSRFVQYGFYVLLLLMPLSGWIMSQAAGKTPRFFNLFYAPLPGVSINKSLSSFMFQVHNYLAWTLILFISLHIMGALKHYFVDKDSVLKSMLP